MLECVVSSRANDSGAITCHLLKTSKCSGVKVDHKGEAEGGGSGVGGGGFSSYSQFDFLSYF